MYYAEEVISGILCHRGTPDGEWIPFTAEELTRKYMFAQDRISRLVSEIEEAAGAMDE